MSMNQSLLLFLLFAYLVFSISSKTSLRKIKERTYSIKDLMEFSEVSEILKVDFELKQFVETNEFRIKLMTQQEVNEKIESEAKKINDLNLEKRTLLNQELKSDLINLEYLKNIIIEVEIGNFEDKTKELLEGISSSQYELKSMLEGKEEVISDFIKKDVSLALLIFSYFNSQN